MIVQIAGTSGSGKSYLVRQFLAWGAKNGKVTECKAGTKLVGYDVKVKEYYPIHVIGPYREGVDTAGCDSIRNIDQVFALIAQAEDENKDVLFEGLFMMNHTRGPQLVEKYEAVKVVQLTDPLAVCLQSINDRRSARGDDKLLSKKNTEGNYVRAANYCDKMYSAGAGVIRTKRADALEALLEALKEPLL